MSERTERRPIPRLWVALVPVAFLVGALWVSLVHFAELELTTHVPLVLSTVVAATMAAGMGYGWEEIQRGMVKGISLAMGAILILLVIGILVATWIQAGIVPAMVAYGLDLL